jgi:hypothetical protein
MDGYSSHHTLILMKGEASLLLKRKRNEATNSPLEMGNGNHLEKTCPMVSVFTTHTETIDKAQE